MRLKIKLIYAFVFASFIAFAQDTPPDNWYNLDSSTNGVAGVGTEKTYETLLKGKPSATIIVAVIDGGVDYEHEDLKSIMWVNEGEIPNNGKDDDRNGYVDDIHGWNFIGGKDGKNVGEDTLEATRLYAKLKKKFGSVGESAVSSKDKKDYTLYQNLKKEVEAKREEAANNLAEIQNTATIINGALDAMEKALDGKKLTIENVNAVETGTDRYLMIGKEILTNVLNDQPFPDIKTLKEEFNKQNEPAIEYYSGQLVHYDADFDPRSIVGDDYNNSYEKYYGNNDIKGPDAHHGTHVSGIIAAVRNNDVGINGVADNVRIMGIRAVPDGDERDKDVANAIIYAVDNGASVINMSFGKGYSWDKRAVDKAVKYAMKKDVLLVHAAGNSAQNNDNMGNFPNDKFKKKGLFGPKNAKNWISVGALSWKKGEDAIATFSNYGKTQVDVFAPGVDIYSTTPEQGYEFASGTSMASPVTAGVAALIRSYYPSLTAVQVREVILNSTSKQSGKVKVPGSKAKVSFSELCQTGGIVNAYEAIKLASKTKGKKKNAPKVQAKKYPKP